MREYAGNCLVMAISTDSLASQVLSMSLSIFSSLRQRKLKCYFVQTKGSRYFLMDFHFWTKGTGYFKKSNKSTKILIRIIKKSHKTLRVSECHWVSLCVIFIEFFPLVEEWKAILDWWILFFIHFNQVEVLEVLLDREERNHSELKVTFVIESN